MNIKQMSGKVVTKTDKCSPKSYLLNAIIIRSFKHNNLFLKNKDKYPSLSTDKSSSCVCDSRGTAALTRARYGN